MAIAQKVKNANEYIELLVYLKMPFPSVTTS
jgi:hypothetical protein